MQTVSRPKLYRCESLKTYTLFDMFVFVWQLYQLSLVFIPNKNEYSPCQYQLPTAPTYSLSPSCQQNKTKLILGFIHYRLHVNTHAQTQSSIQYINQHMYQIKHKSKHTIHCNYHLLDASAPEWHLQGVY